MTPPKTIYLQVCCTCQDNECDNCDFDQLSEVTWCKDRIHDNDVAYFSEEHIRAVANELYNNGEPLIVGNRWDNPELLKGGGNDQ